MVAPTRTRADSALYASASAAAPGGVEPAPVEAHQPHRQAEGTGQAASAIAAAAAAGAAAGGGCVRADAAIARRAGGKAQGYSAGRFWEHAGGKRQRHTL